MIDVQTARNLVKHSLQNGDAYFTKYKSLILNSIEIDIREAAKQGFSERKIFPIQDLVRGIAEEPTAVSDFQVLSTQERERVYLLLSKELSDLGFSYMRNENSNEATIYYY